MIFFNHPTIIVNYRRQKGFCVLLFLFLRLFQSFVQSRIRYQVHKEDFTSVKYACEQAKATL